MSRGYGWVERKILEVLSDGLCYDLYDMPYYVFNKKNPTKSQYKSVARAVHRLEHEKNQVKSVISKTKLQHDLHYQQRINSPRWFKVIWKVK